MIKRFMKIFATLFFCLFALKGFSQTKDEILSLEKYFKYITNLSINDNRWKFEINDSISSEYDWDLKSSFTYQTALNELQIENYDYRYYLTFAKIANGDWNDEGFLINNYYKYKFLVLAIEQGTNITEKQKNTLKLSLVYTYDLSRSLKGGFSSSSDFKEYANKISEYVDDLLTLSRSYPKGTVSELHRIKASVLYDIYYKGEKDTERLSEVLKNLKFAIDNDPTNRLAIRDRANIKFDDLKDYSGALQDFIKEYNLRIANNANTKNFYIKCYPIIQKIGDCLFHLDRYSEVITWYNKAITEINIQTKRTKNWGDYTINEMKNDLGLFYYRKAICYHIIKQNNLACNELRKAIEVGFNVQDASETFKEYNCR
jgi:hypothetical protein